MSEDRAQDAAVRVEEMIVTVRGDRVILDQHLARLYGVTTKALNQAVKRNPGRFPADFVYQLTFQEVTGLRSQIVTSNTAPDRSQPVTGSRGGRRYPPYAFTAHGALMAANVLNSPRAVQMRVCSWCVPSCACAAPSRRPVNSLGSSKSWNGNTMPGSRLSSMRFAR